MHPGWTLLIVLGLAFLLFGKPGKISGLMEDLGKGIRGFRKGLSEGDAPASPPSAPAEPPRQVPDQSATAPASPDRTQS